MAKRSVFHPMMQEPRLAAEEVHLLAQINRGFAEKWWNDFHALVSKRQKRTLSSAEHQELIQMTDELEKREAKRLKALAKLAKLRDEPLAVVMKSLGLPGKTLNDE
ncbi:MAG TPA: hypothetical protein VE988_12155 [Gemmataceae bacterium]|nr:hypothetical protein [Gemmataceae bacterium]